MSVFAIPGAARNLTPNLNSVVAPYLHVQCVHISLICNMLLPLLGGGIFFPMHFYAVHSADTTGKADISVPFRHPVDLGSCNSTVQKIGP